MPELKLKAVSDDRVNITDSLLSDCLSNHIIYYNTGQLVSMTPEQMQAYRWEREIDERNRPLSDEELDTMFPKDGYKVVCYVMEKVVVVHRGK